MPKNDRGDLLTFKNNVSYILNHWILKFYIFFLNSISGDKTSVRLDYAEPLTGKLLRPLIEKKADGVDETLEIMKAYSLLREDLTNLCELMTSFSNRNNNPFDKVASTVRALVF